MANSEKHYLSHATFIQGSAKRQWTHDLNWTYLGRSHNEHQMNALWTYILSNVSVLQQTLPHFQKFSLSVTFKKQLLTIVLHRIADIL